MFNINVIKNTQYISNISLKNATSQRTSYILWRNDD